MLKSQGVPGIKTGAENWPDEVMAPTCSPGIRALQKGGANVSGAPGEAEGCYGGVQ